MFIKLIGLLQNINAESCQFIAFERDFCSTSHNSEDNSNLYWQVICRGMVEVNSQIKSVLID